MITPKQMPLEKILKTIEGIENILIVGSDGCSGIYMAGGIKQAETLATLIKMHQQLNNEPGEVRHTIVLRQGDRQLVATTLRPQMENVDGSGTPTVILELEGDAMPSDYIDWSINDQIIFTMSSNGDREVCTIDCYGEHAITVLGTNTSCEYYRWSPDGTRLC